MKIIKLYEEFTQKTLDINNDEYNLYFNHYKDEEDGETKVVMWMNEGSQERNFNLVSKYLKSGESLLDYGCGIGGFTKYLENNNISISDYLGVDINNNFIEFAKEKHSEYKFQHITDPNQINGKWDNVVSIGVFSWYIERNEFITTINKLYNSANNQVLITCNYGNFEDTDNYWNLEYRFYNENIFKELFPNYNISFDFETENGYTTMLVIIKK